MKQIPASSLLCMVKKLLEFPFPQICRHSVACDLLSLLEENGVEISHELAEAVVKCDDERGLSLLQTLDEK